MNNQPGCDYEHAVVKSLKSGFINDEINEHIKRCANCAEAAKIVRFFQTNLIKESQPKHLPAAGLVWWKSRLREKQRNAERVSQPIFIIQTVAATVFTGLFVWLLNTESFQISQFGTGLNRVFAAMEQIMASLIIGVICFLFVSLILIFALRRFMLEK